MTEALEGAQQEISLVAAKLGGRAEVINLSDIEPGDRYRHDYGDLNELALSLTENGQLQNIVVCIQNHGSEKPYKLLAGGRRFKTMTEKLRWDKCRALIFDHELDELEMLTVEWCENKDRKELDWKEDCAIKKRIYELQLEKYGAKIGKSKDSAGVSLNGIAAELGVSTGTMCQDVNLAKAVALSPELFSQCKNKKEAGRLLNKATEQLARSELAKRVTEVAGTEVRLKSLIDRFIVGDCIVGAKAIPDSTIDFVEIDPPYAIALQQIKRAPSLNIRDYNEVEAGDYIDFISSLLGECRRVMSDHSYGVLWHAVEWAVPMYELLHLHGFEVARLTGKWIKPVGQTQQPDRYLANACEEFFYFWKGSPSIVQQGRSNIFAYNPVPGQKKSHPTERPMELISEILRTFCWEGSRIWVPFLGSGTTILAAETLKMTAFGHELSPSYKDNYVLKAGMMFGEEMK